MSRRFKKDELLDMDFNVYLASSSSEDEEEEEDRVNVSSATVREEVEKEGSEQLQQQEEEKKKKEKGEQQISKYRELLRGLQEKEKKQQEDKDMEMEITWVPGEASTKQEGKSMGQKKKGQSDPCLFILFMRAGLRDTTEKLVKKKLEGKETLTPWEEFLEKKKEKKKHKKKNKKVSNLKETGKHLLATVLNVLTFDLCASSTTDGRGSRRRRSQ